jgi:long-chain fatty acid transport protein
LILFDLFYTVANTLHRAEKLADIPVNACLGKTCSVNLDNRVEMRFVRRGVLLWGRDANYVLKIKAIDMQRQFQRPLLIGLLALTAGIFSDGALAADGYFLIGYGARQKALAGADVADSKDAMALAVNPAGIVGLERQWQFGMTALLPERGYSTYGQPVVLAPGDVRSGRPIFPVPNDAYVEPIDADSAWGFASYANGGINTSYDIGHFKPPIVAGPLLIAPTYGGILGGGFGGVDLEQAFFSVGYSRRFGSISVGIAPTLAAQMLNIQGLKILSVYSSDPWRFTDMGYSWSFGGGVRAGLEWRATNQLRFAFAGSTPMFMSAFSDYSGLLAEHGGFDIPANITAGAAYDFLPELTLMVDWKHIFYSGVKSLANPGFPIWNASFGLAGGPGFDWRDTDSVAFGAEWRATNELTVRTGYHYTTNPIRSRAATIAALTPAISKHHVSGGFNYKVTKNSSIDFAAVYAFKNSITAPENVPYVGFSTFPVFPVNIMPHYNSNANVTSWLRGLELTLGFTYKFDAGSTNWIPTHL